MDDSNGLPDPPTDPSHVHPSAGPAVPQPSAADVGAAASEAGALESPASVSPNRDDHTASLAAAASSADGPLEPWMCGAKRRRGGFCHAAAMPNGRCRVHGGTSLAGTASATFKHGRYSKSLAASLPTRLRERFEAAMSDPELLSLRKYVALFDVRAAEAAEKLASLDTGSYRTTLLRLWDEFARANSERIAPDDSQAEERRAAKAARITELLTDIGKTIRDGAQEEEVWQEVFAAVKDRMAATREEHRRLVDLEQTLTVEQAFALAARLGDAVRMVVQDRDTLSRISAAIERTLVVDQVRSLPPALAGK